MNAGTPTSVAPGVSVRGRMRSAIAVTSVRSAAVNDCACAAGLAPSRIGSHSADTVMPASSAARRIASRRLMPVAAGSSRGGIIALTGSAC